MKKKYKLKTKNIAILAVIIIALITLVLLISPVINIVKLTNLGYKLDESITIYRSGFKDKIKEKGYSEIVARQIDNPDFKEEYIDNYYQIDSMEYSDFLKITNNLIAKNYSNKDINLINKNYDKDFLDYLQENYVEDISKYLEYDFFKPANIDRYLSYFNNDYKDTIVKVNIGLDRPYYENPNIVKEYNPNMLVNKYNKLDSNFNSNNLTELNNCTSKSEKFYLSEDAKKAYDNLCAASKKEGMNISVNSAYRSYESQKETYDYYYKAYGQSYVDKYVALPGFSEHQTGLSLDIKSLNSNIFEKSKEYTWMKENAYKYGFILRYPEGKEKITGCNKEAWHYRYVGVEIAKYIYENNITYDEYYIMFLDK